METLAMPARTSTLGRKMENKKGPEGFVWLVAGAPSYTTDAAGRRRER
jgi:hypothetical protein